MEQTAIKKINQQFGDGRAKLSQKGKIVGSAVVSAITEFCRQNIEFAQAVIQSDNTIIDCIEHTVKKSTDAISDLDVYKNAVSFYFSGADVHFNMSIDLGDNGFSNSAIKMLPPAENQPDNQQENITVCLDSLLDF